MVQERFRYRWHDCLLNIPSPLSDLGSVNICKRLIIEQLGLSTFEHMISVPEESNTKQITTFAMQAGMRWLESAYPDNARGWVGFNVPMSHKASGIPYAVYF